MADRRSGVSQANTLKDIVSQFHTGDDALNRDGKNSKPGALEDPGHLRYHRRLGTIYSGVIVKRLFPLFAFLVAIPAPAAALAANTIDASLIPDGTYTVKVEKVIDPKHVQVTMDNGAETCSQRVATASTFEGQAGGLGQVFADQGFCDGLRRPDQPLIPSSSIHPSEGR